MQKIRNTIFCFLAALIWGFAFVTQFMGNAMGPFTFSCLRLLMGSLALIPFLRFYYGDLKIDSLTLKVGCLNGLLLCFGINLQQLGLLWTSPGKAGFISAFYIILVPILSIALGKKVKKILFLAVVLGLAGLFLLCVPPGESLTKITKGDFLMLLSSLFFTAQILVIDRFAGKVEGIKLSFVQVTVCGLLSGVLMLLLERPTLAMIAGGWMPLVFTGIFSTCFAYTLQIVGQQGVNPTVASLIFSFESVFSVLGSWLILHQVLSAREMIGCAVMFAAVLLTLF